MLIFKVICIVIKIYILFKKKRLNKIIGFDEKYLVLRYVYLYVYMYFL